jgi:hypothetical protein
VTHFDWRYGRPVNANLADYHVPVNLDIGSIEVSAIDAPDYKLDSSELGAWARLGYGYLCRDCQCGVSRDRQACARYADYSR